MLPKDPKKVKAYLKNRSENMKIKSKGNHNAKGAVRSYEQRLKMSEANRRNGWVYRGHRRMRIMGKTIYEHQLVWIQHYGPIPDNCVIHHKDFNGLNNNIENLELMPWKEHVRLHNNLRRGLFYGKK